MAEEGARRALGRGLAALIGDVGNDAAAGEGAQPKARADRIPAAESAQSPQIVC